MKKSESLTIREAVPQDADAIARVHVDSWHETYRGLLPDSVLAGVSYAERERQWSAALSREEPCTFVAEAHGTIVGFATGGPNRDPGDPAYARYPGELYAIYLLAAHQKQGTGRALFEQVRKSLQARALVPFLLWVLDRNPACEFYERLGGHKIVTQPAEIRGAHIIEHGYGWS